MPVPSFDTEKFLLMVGNVFRRRKALWAILAISLVARIALVLKGGQFYYPDETRYLNSLYFLHYLARFDLRTASDLVLGTGAHVGFIFAGVPAAIVHIVYLGIRGLPETQASAVATAWVSGLCFAVPSVISIAMVYAISRRAAATSAEALLAAFLMACSNAMFYYCRHFLPYDLSMALALFSLWLGIAEKTTRWVSLRCGLILGIAMLTYNGCWITGAVVLAFHVLYRVPSAAAAVERAVLAALAAISPLAVLTAMSVLLGKEPYLSLMRRFAGAVNQGDFREGAVFPFLYLWHTEYAVALAWAATTLLALWYCRTEDWRRRPFIPLCIGAIVATYGLLVLGSVGLGVFVVMGRSVRQLVPWLCFTSAYGIARAFHQGSRYRIALAAICVGLVTQAAYNMSHPFRQRFPAEVRQAVHSRYGNVDYDVSFHGPPVDGSQASPFSTYVLVNAQMLYPLLSWKAPFSGDVLFSVPHPYAYPPYQYEGLNPRERDLLLQGDYSMRLIRRSPQPGNSQQSPKRP